MSPPLSVTLVPRPPTPTAPSLARDPVLVCLGLAAAVTVLWVLLGPAGVALSWTAQTILDVVLVHYCWRVARISGASAPVRRFWQAFGVGGLFFATGDALQALTAWGDPAAEPRSSTLQSIIVAAGVAYVVWTMLTHPINVAGQERLRLWLDAATVMTAVGVFAWALALSGGGMPDTGANIMAALVSSGLMLVSAFGIVKLLLSGAAPFTVKAGVLGGAASALFGVVASLDPLIAGTSQPELVTVARLLPCFLVAATPRIQELQIRADPGILAPRQRPYSKLPYVAVAALQILLIRVLITDGLSMRAWGVIAGVVTVTVLVVIRQLVAFNDNIRLLTNLRRHEERFRSLVQHASDLTIVVDARGAVAYASPALDRILGIESTGVIGRVAGDWIHLDDLPTARSMMDQLRHDPHDSLTIQFRARHRDGSWRWLEVVGTNLLDNPSVRGIVLNARDVTEARHFQDRLRHEATHDPLTRLANRALFHQEIGMAAFISRGPTDETAIVAIDLDDFKQVNDTHGHHAGDALLVAVAKRLEQCVRPTDTVARLGGDEFAVLLPHTSRSVALAVADRMMAAFADPVEVDGHLLRIRASLGVAVGSADDADSLLRQADAAMYAAKQSGTGRITSAVS